MSMKLFNVRGGSRACAFCRYWYDPCNRAIKPDSPGAGFWRYDTSAKALCLKKVGTKMPSWASCSQYERKV